MHKCTLHSRAEVTQLANALEKSLSPLKPSEGEGEALILLGDPGNRWHRGSMEVAQVGDPTD